METCSNCDRVIGKMETPCLWREEVVCFDCHEKLKRQSRVPQPAPSLEAVVAASTGTSGPRSLADLARIGTAESDAAAAALAYPRQPIKALGLTSRGQATAVMIVGFFLAPVVAGVPLIVWGALADHQMVQEMRRRHMPVEGGGRTMLFSILLAAIVFITVLMILSR